MKGTIIGAALLLASTGAFAAPPADDPSPEAPKDERKICRTEKATGSLTRRTRVCLTPTQWRELNDRTRKGLDEFVGAASGGCMAGRSGRMCE